MIQADDLLYSVDSDGNVNRYRVMRTTGTRAMFHMGSDAGYMGRDWVRLADIRSVASLGHGASGFLFFDRRSAAYIQALHNAAFKVEFFAQKLTAAKTTLDELIKTAQDLGVVETAYYPAKENVK